MARPKPVLVDRATLQSTKTVLGSCRRWPSGPRLLISQESHISPNISIFLQQGLQVSLSRRVTSDVRVGLLSQTSVDNHAARPSFPCCAETLGSSDGAPVEAVGVYMTLPKKTGLPGARGGGGEWLLLHIGLCP